MGVFYFSEHTCVDLYVCISNSLLPDKIQHFLTKCQLDCIFIFMNEIISRNKFSFLSLVRKKCIQKCQKLRGRKKERTQSWWWQWDNRSLNIPCITLHLTDPKFVPYRIKILQHWQQDFFDFLNMQNMSKASKW